MEQPVDEALAPVYASMPRIVVLLLVGFGLPVVASLVLARRMVTPIHALQEGAARIGAGALDQQIVVRTGDELEALADTFNQMTARLRELYASLEQKLVERTRDLSEALEQQTALAGVLRVIAILPADAQRVLDAIVETAARLCDAEGAVLQRLRPRDGRLAPRAISGNAVAGMTQGFASTISRRIRATC